MDQFDDFRLFLPKYLSPDAETALYEELRHYPDNIDKRMYSDPGQYGDLLNQGDGLRTALIVDLPAREFRDGPAMIVSNSCDLDIKNKRVAHRILYCPILPISRYEDWYRQRIGRDEPHLGSHLTSIRAQHVSSMFYLPTLNDSFPESVALLDRVNNCDLKYYYELDNRRERHFALSDYGFYMFLFKLSIYFTRVQEGFERS
jgi:hypothetical protein